MKTPSMPTSRMRKEIMYSFTRSVIGLKLARMLIQVSSVVSTTSTRLMPSTPSLYWMPKAGIHSATSLRTKPCAAASAGSKPASSASESPKVSRAMPSALDDVPDAVDRAIHDGPVEPPDEVGDAATEAHEEQVVELVEPPLAEGGLVEARRARGERRHPLRPRPGAVAAQRPVEAEEADGGGQTGRGRGHTDEGERPGGGGGV